MNITLSPYGGEETLELVKDGNRLTINGELFDFTRMAEGDTLPGAAITCAFINRDVDYIGGHLTLVVRFPNPWNYSPEQAFPEPLLDIPDGPIALPQPLSEEQMRMQGELQA